MAPPREYEIQLYAAGDEISARCTCGRWTEDFPDGTGLRTVTHALGAHMATHPGPPEMDGAK